MKKTRAIALLLTAGLSAGTVAQVPIATSQEAPAQTMAEIYQPYCPDWVGTPSAAGGYPVIYSDEELPPNTVETMLDSNRGDNLRRDNGLLYSYSSNYLFGEGNFNVQFHSGAVLNPDGNKSVGRVLFQYPDGSSEIVTCNMTAIAPTSDWHNSSYPDVVFTEENAEELRVLPTQEVPSETRFSLVENQGIDDWIENGWSIVLDEQTGELSITYPGGGGEFNILVSVTYQDGSHSSESVRVHVSEPQPEPTPESEPQPEPQPDPEPIRKNGSSSLFSSSF